MMHSHRARGRKIAGACPEPIMIYMWRCSFVVSGSVSTQDEVARSSEPITFSTFSSYNSISCPASEIRIPCYIQPMSFTMVSSEKSPPIFGQLAFP